MIELKPDVIGVRLKELREKRGLSHEKLADELMVKYGNGQTKKPISIDSLKAYEVSDNNHSKFGNQKGMKIENFIMLANFYNVSLDYLLGVENETSHDMKYICSVTKLTEDAVDKLEKLPSFAHIVNYITKGWLPYLSEIEMENLFSSIEKYVSSNNINSRESAMDMLEIQERFTSLKCCIQNKEIDTHKRLL